jgi:hypothetical protein
MNDQTDDQDRDDSVAAEYEFGIYGVVLEHG